QPADFDEFAQGIARRYRVARGQMDQLHPSVVEQGPGGHEQRIGPLVGNLGKGRIDLAAGIAGAAACNCRNCVSVCGSAGSRITATLAARGTSSRSSPRRLPVNSVDM